MTRKFLITAAAVTAVSGMALAQAQLDQGPAVQQRQDQQPTQVPTAQPAGGSMQGQQQQLTDQEFVTQAASGGKYEIKCAEIVQDKVDDPQLKQAATNIERDHKKAMDELKRIAKDKNLTWSDDMDAQHEAMCKQLKDQDKEQMAQTYKQQQIQAHKDSISLFQRASTQLQDPELKQFAQRQLPVLQQHLTSIQGSTHDMQAPGAQPAGATLDREQPKDESKDTPKTPYP